MNILALDTSTPRASVAVSRADGGLFVALPDPGVRHGRALVPAIREVLLRAGVKLAALDGLAVGLGPGSYTGLRVGVTAAKTLAYVLSKPLAGVDSLEAIARGAPGDARYVSVVADAQRGDLFTADFERDAAGAPPRRVSATRVESAEGWRNRLLPGTLVMGPAVVAGLVAGPSDIWAGQNLDNHPQGGPLVELGREALRDGRTADLWFLEPVYHRRSAAEDLWEARLTGRFAP